jgi:hypothetical protein
MKSFYVFSLRDAANAYEKALQSAGYIRSQNVNDADFILTDKEPTSAIHREKFIKLIAGRPVFYFPHTPYAYWLWDGKLPMHTPICCNFVVGEGAVMGMKAYGYPYRVEKVGFPRCEVKPFKPTNGTNLLYAPPRLMGAGWWWNQGEREAHLKAMRWIIENIESFDNVTVNYSVSKELSNVTDFEGYSKVRLMDIGNSRRLGAKTAIKAFDGVDLVISCKTLGYLAVANGIPAILYGYEEGETYRSDHYELYRSHYEFPLKLHNMTIDDVLNVRAAENSSVEQWKRVNIGTSFDAAKFLSIVDEYL